MIKYKTLEELREANRKRALKYYNKIKDTEEYKEKKRQQYERRKKQRVKTL